MTADALDTRYERVIMFPARNSALPNKHDEDFKMSINKLLIALALGVALAACSKSEPAADAAADANAAAADAQAAADSAATAADAAAAPAADAAAPAAAPADAAAAPAAEEAKK
jgi:hypothetical protein